jgi:p-aminobenzoyl-glutamate transporter AbgT
MTLALSVIGLTVVTLVLAARLGDANRQLAQARRESAEQERRAREEQAAYQYGTAMALACLLAGLAAAHWPTATERPRTARFKAGTRVGAEDQGAGR